MCKSRFTEHQAIAAIKSVGMGSGHGKISEGLAVGDLY